ncbi:DinB family protein [Actinoplanes sichuanensis]|uniref:DinB family protein n=1 Tax=Actinoplanes sichuanensis TaxID=512349 RepID=A0ABW4AHJ5_9ACTN|nr:DinB family protein [Actinoplanes sichuanensis]BEL12264.1 DinB family protein [Actinoplanes sichuanensis]
MTIEFPSPTIPAANRAEVFTRYLDYFRETLLVKTAALPETELRTSRLPSGWTPLELVKHLRHVERRWIEWGFEGRDIPDPWADQRDDRWHVDDSETLAGLTAELRAQGTHTTAAITGNDLDAVGVPGPRWSGADPATLERVCLHLVQEYARHVGHLDIVAESAGVPTGE